VNDRDIWLTGLQHLTSPNADQRPCGITVDLLVIHNISLPPGEFGGPWIDELFLGRLEPGAHPYFEQIARLRVSSHLLIRRDGRATQFVALNHRAWHAGQSTFCGRERCNDYSIGIELEGSDDCPFTDAQYSVLSKLTRTVMEHFPAISSQRIVGHCDIAPGRKTDPGPHFDWIRFRQGLAETDQPVGSG
jgi:AmpD protein